jgi:TolB-like protein
MPFENQGETQYGWISDELTQSVIQDLGLISSVDIITDQERQNTLKTEGSVLDLKDPEAVLRLGKMTGADLIFSASYTVVNDRVRVIARLIDVAGGAAGKYLKIDNTIERRRELKNMIIFALMEQAGNYTFVGRIKSLITENERRQIESK